MIKTVWEKIKEGAIFASAAIVEMADLPQPRNTSAREGRTALAKAFRDLAERLDPTPRPVESANRRHWPHGRMPWLRNLPAIVVCKNEAHRRSIAETFPIPGAYYTTFGSALTGMRTDKIIIFEPDVPYHLAEELRIKLAEQHVDYVTRARCRLAAGRRQNFYLL